jgi:pyridoxamine 5'-phosphate oxidase
MFASHVAAAAAAAALALWLERRRARYSHIGGSSFQPLDPALDLPPSPYELLRRWMADAEAESGFLESHAMTIATADAEGGPTARTVVLQVVDEQLGGLLFGSNRFSLKARQVTADGRAEAVLRFGQRQVRMRGKVRLEEGLTALSYKHVAPTARLGLATLEQGRSIDEEAHGKLAADIRNRMLDGGGQAPAKPPRSYVAFVLTPGSFEFYNGGHPAYLNDRFLYVQLDGGGFAAPVRLQA